MNNKWSWMKNMQNTYIKDHHSFTKTLERFVKDGASNLQVICDFDYTISKFQENGNRCCTSHEVLEEVPKFNPETVTKLINLREYFTKMERDESLDAELKGTLLQQWWSTSHDYIVKEGITKEMITEDLDYTRLPIREGFSEMVAQLRKHGIPITIFSAGLGDIIREAIKRNGVNPDEVNILSNFLDIGSQKYASGFIPPTINSANKCFSTLMAAGSNQLNVPFNVTQRSNVIVIGDSKLDLYMVNGLCEILQKEVCTLNIAFYNDREDELLESYKDNFHMVLKNHENYHVLCTLFQWMSKHW